MPRVHQRVIGSALYLYRNEPEAEEGEQIGGSGFIVGQPSERNPNTVHLYAVTNAHVAGQGGVVPRAMTHRGEVRVFDRSRHDWWLHPDGDDVAICWLGTQLDDSDLELQWIRRDWIVRAEDFGIGPSRLEFPWMTGPVVAGEDTFSVIRFIGYDGRERNAPMVRFGNLTSAEPIGIWQEYAGIRRIQESFLIEARSLLGHSGAPVFAYRLGSYFDGGAPPIETPLLLGIGFGHLKHPEDEKAEFELEMARPGRPTPGRYNAGIMTVVPGWKLADLLDSPPVAEARRVYEDGLGQSMVALD